MNTWHQLVKDNILLHEAKLLYCKGQMDVTQCAEVTLWKVYYIYRIAKETNKKKNLKRLIDWTRDRMLAITNQEIVVIGRTFIS